MAERRDALKSLIEEGLGDPVYNLFVMSSRFPRLLAMVLLAAFALDVGDADCVVGPWTGDAARASLDQRQTIGADPTGGCACCIAAEAACPVTHFLMAELPAAVVAPESDRARAGVYPIPYRPPLCPS